LKRLKRLFRCVVAIDDVRAIFFLEENYRRVGKGEFHPQASHRTVRETLASYGSCHFYYVRILITHPCLTGW